MKKLGVVIIALLLGISPGFSHELVETEDMRNEVVIVRSELQSHKKSTPGEDIQIQSSETVIAVLDMDLHICDFVHTRLYLRFHSLKLCE